MILKAPATRALRERESILLFRSVTYIFRSLGGFVWSWLTGPTPLAWARLLVSSPRARNEFPRRIIRWQDGAGLKINPERLHRRWLKTLRWNLLAWSLAARDQRVVYFFLHHQFAHIFSYPMGRKADVGVTVNGLRYSSPLHVNP